MKLKLIDYLKHRDNENFELRLVVFTNIIIFILSFFSAFTGEILTNAKPDTSFTDIQFLKYNSIFWIAVLILSLTLAELALHEQYFAFSRKVSLYTYTFILIPVGLYITGSVPVTSLYYVLCIAVMNILATPKERLIINPFLFLVIYSYIIISYQFPGILPPQPPENIEFIHFLIDVPVVIGITALFAAGMTETYRKEHNKIKKQNESLEQIIRTDMLTGLFNKTYLQEEFPLLVEEAYAHKSPLSVFIIDIDFFKNYNTLYGNIKGDSCLLEVANILKQNCSNITNHIYRFGGEEFIIICPDTDQHGARILAESIREDFHIKQIDNYRSTICNYLTVSIGVHCYSGLEKSTSDEIIKKADNALYTVKRKGRDDYYITSSAEDEEEK